MLVHWNSHFNIANMKNEVYSERSMSMHSFAVSFFLLAHPVSTHISVDAPFGTIGIVMLTVTVEKG